jgi:hypothetical protein
MAVDFGAMNAALNLQQNLKGDSFFGSDFCYLHSNIQLWKNTATKTAGAILLESLERWQLFTWLLPFW